MASATITRNDLTAILNEVLPPTPSEYKKLLWTNPNPTSSFAAQTISLDLSDYDAIEIVATMYISNSVSYRKAFSGKVGDAFVLSATMYGLTAAVTRLCETNSAQVIINTGYVETTQNNLAVIPYQIYGIKYERVNPPQVEIADVVIEQGTSGSWTYRKWNSGIAECWGVLTRAVNLDQGPYGGSYYGNTTITFPSDMFIAEPQISCTRQGRTGTGLIGMSIYTSSKDSFDVTLWNPGSSVSGLSYGISTHARGRWK